MLDLVSGRLAVAGIVSWATAMLFLTVGRVVAARAPEGDSRFAATAFVWGWYGLGAAAAVDGVIDTSAAWGVHALAWHLGLKLLWYALIAASLWGICTYLLFLFTGERIFTFVLAAYYGAAFAGILLLVSGAEPYAVRVDGWLTHIAYENAGFAGAAPRLTAIILLVPLVGAGLGYLSMLPVVTSRTQRFRIVLVSMTLALWFGVSALVHGLDLHLTQTWAAGRPLLRLASAALLLVAYGPPLWLRQRFRLEPDPAGATSTA